MKAMILKSFGGPDSFELSDVTKPVPQAGQVLVRVHATSINPLDYQVRRGDYPDLVPCPSNICGVYQTSSPGAKALTPEPTASTTPDTSCPVMAGRGTRSG